MNRITLSIIVLLISIFVAGSAKAQITLQCVKPGQELLVKPDGDTLWVMNDARMRSVIETGKLYRISKEQVATLTEKCDTLVALSQQKDSLIEILKTDKLYYQTELKTSREDLLEAGKMAKKYRRRAKLASWGIAAGVAVGLGVGYLLFND
ncbi:MAG: hypothetical protein MJZ66_03135 [Bacteroidales bacterium]|nr:hypothetical protein [Bacteroidales bacterium]MCQ2252782.1 hypothetical protein [Bacteroidales bacterium]